MGMTTMATTTKTTEQITAIQQLLQISVRSTRRVRLWNILEGGGGGITKRKRRKKKKKKIHGPMLMDEPIDASEEGA
jgi:hypothetical protein